MKFRVFVCAIVCAFERDKQHDYNNNNNVWRCAFLAGLSETRRGEFLNRVREQSRACDRARTHTQSKFQLNRGKSDGPIESRRCCASVGVIIITDVARTRAHIQLAATINGFK